MGPLPPGDSLPVVPEMKSVEPEEKSEMKPERPEKKKRPRKDVLCETCGKTYSSLTKAHTCQPPKGFVKVEGPRPESPARPRANSPSSPWPAANSSVSVRLLKSL